jgi:hypothetical protein
MAVFMGMAVLGGLWIPLQIFPAWVANVAQVVPSYWLNRIGQMGAHQAGDILTPAIVLLGWTLRSPGSSSGGTGGMRRAADAGAYEGRSARSTVIGMDLASRTSAERPVTWDEWWGRARASMTDRATRGWYIGACFGLLYQALTVIAVWLSPGTVPEKVAATVLLVAVLRDLRLPRTDGLVGAPCATASSR